MFYRLVKFAVGGAYLVLIAAMIGFLCGTPNWSWAKGALLFGASWLALTIISLPSILTLYFNWFSRLRFQYSLITGLLLAAVAGVAIIWQEGADPWLLGVLGVQLIAWFAVWLAYRRNRARFIMTSHGPLPSNAWINPPASVFQPGDWMIFSGSFGPNYENPAGHAELCLEKPDGTRVLFSCWIPKGVVIHQIDELVARWLRTGAHHTGLRQRVPLSAAETVRSYELAEQMKAENVAYVERTTQSRQALIARLPLPQNGKQWLLKKCTPTGYDFSGLVIGRRASDHWTCIGACLELLHRLGRKIRDYGTGLLGWGTGLFDPLNPARLYTDPNYELLTIDHQSYFEKHGRLPPVGHFSSQART